MKIKNRIFGVKYIGETSMKKTSVILIIICIASIYFNPINAEDVQTQTSHLQSDSSLNTTITSINSNSYSKNITNIQDSNFVEDLQKLSQRSDLKSECSFQNYNYVIISTMDLYDEILSSNFINWKQKIGYNIRIVNEN